MCSLDKNDGAVNEMKWKKKKRFSLNLPKSGVYLREYFNQPGSASAISPSILNRRIPDPASLALGPKTIHSMYVVRQSEIDTSNLNKSQTLIIASRPDILQVLNK